jgi:hypothetical protein
MARESRRKREGRRLGVSRLFLEILLERDWCVPKHLAHYGASVYGGLQSDYDMLKKQLARCFIVDNRNVCDYVIQESDPEGKFRHGFDVSRDLPGFRPQFDSLFLDCSTVKTAPYIPPRWGVMLRTYPPKGEGAETVIGYLFMQTPTDKIAPIIVFMVSYNDAFDVESINPVRYFPLSMLSGDALRSRDFHDASDPQFRHMCSLIPPALLGVSFMNCKNVTLSTIEPDARLNRERQKAGLKPFLRYHTINIEPMKQILRTEGDIENNGLKKALHICRGHFARYVPERGGPFGRKIEEPVMIWHPSHVRGSAKQGVVFSDYNVKAPKDGGGEDKGQPEGTPC